MTNGGAPSSAAPKAPAGPGPADRIRTTVFAAKPLDLGHAARRYRRTHYVNLAMPFVLLGIWQLISTLGLLDRRFFSAPSSIVGVVWDLERGGLLWTAIWATRRRVLIGFSTGGVAGILVGVVAARYWFVRMVVNPIVAATYPVPKIAILPVLLLIFGTGDTSIYVVVGLSVFYVVLMNTVAGVSNIPNIYQDVARTLDVGGIRYLTTIAVPGALPVIFAALRTSLGVALLIDIAAEFTSANVGLGQLIVSSWQVFEVNRMYAALVLTGLLGWLSFLIMDVLERVLIPWKRGLER